MASNDLKLKTKCRGRRTFKGKKEVKQFLIKIPKSRVFFPNEMTMTYKTKVILNPNV